jgi:hypothetical protein
MKIRLRNLVHAASAVLRRSRASTQARTAPGRV